jgi:hypothetical protein
VILSSKVDKGRARFGRVVDLDMEFITEMKGPV